MFKSKFLKSFLIVLAILMISGVGYAAWRVNTDIKKITIETNKCAILPKTYGNEEQDETATTTVDKIKNVAQNNTDKKTGGIIENKENLKQTDISRWKTYRNMELKIEFKYPETWREREKNEKWWSVSPLVHNDKIVRLMYCDGPGCSAFETPEVGISLYENIGDDTVYLFENKKTYRLVCEEKQSRLREDGTLIESCGFRIYRGEIEDSAIKVFCAQKQLNRSCLFFRITKPVDQITNKSFKQYKPYINKEIDEQYKDIINGIMSTFKITS